MNVLNKENYKKICYKCDEILFEKIDNVFRVANPYLHLIKPHPFFLKNYETLVSKKIYLKQLFIYKISKTLLLFFRNIFYASSFENQLSKVKNSDVVVISHLVSGNDFKNKGDFYFGQFNREINTLFCLMNHTKKKSKQFVSNKNNNFILENYLGFIEEVSILFLMFKEYFSLFINGLMEKDNLKKKIFYNAANSSISVETSHAIRIGRQVEQIIKKARPKILLITFEGYSWERVAIYFSKKTKKKIKCIGYLHSAIFKNQHSIFRTLNKDYDPDIIFLSSENMKRQYNKMSKNMSLNTFSLGSLKKDNNKKLVIRGKACLVLPEGIFEESKLMLDFVLECANQNPKVKFIFRLHPIIKVSSLLKTFKYKLKIPNNVVISSNSLDEDIKLSKVVVYRGSTSVINAISNGLIPIYLDLGESFSIDPLFDYIHGKFIISKAQEFNNIYNKAQSSIKLIKFCNNFYDSYKHDLLLDFINTKISLN